MAAKWLIEADRILVVAGGGMSVVHSRQIITEDYKVKFPYIKKLMHKKGQ